MINRCAVVVRAKRPFLEWLKNLPDPIDSKKNLSDINREPHVYLLPEYEINDEKALLLAYFYDTIFETELGGWWTNMDDWPRNRTLAMFKDWFSVEFHTIVEDLLDAPLLDED